MKLHNELTDTFQQAMRGKKGCLFCHPFEGMIMHETDHFWVLIDTFPVTDGHLMISSKDHYGSSGEIPEFLYDELFALKQWLTDKVKSINGSFICYEHGRAGCCLSKNPGQKCEHFHMHFLPVNISITKELSSEFQEIRMKDFKEISTLFNREGDYLYFEDSFGNMFFYPAANEKVKSHLLRTLICEQLETPELAKWEDFKDEQAFLNSYDLIKHFFGAECAYDLFG